VSDDARTTLVGILSDTHGRLPDAAFAALADCDFIIHAGDIGAPQVLRALETLAPTYAVLGNNDFDEYGATVRWIIRPTIAGVRFLIAHYPRDIHASMGRAVEESDGAQFAQICVHGHTHVPKITTGLEAKPAQYLICPGSVSSPRMGSGASIAKLTITGGQVQNVWLEGI